MAPTDLKGHGPKTDYCVLGVPFWNPSYEQFKEWWDGHLASDSHPVLLELANPHTLNIASKDCSFRGILISQTVNLNDGVGVSLAARMRGVRTRYSFAGTDLMPRLFSEARLPLRVFFYGATEESNRLSVENILRDHPNVVCAGRLNGFVDGVQVAVPAIRESGADVLMCALGQPRQELFMSENLSSLNVKFAVSCGGMFDFFSGLKPRAPLAMRRAGLEWFYRLAIEPKRMFARYVVGNPLFLTRAFIARSSDIKCAAESSESRWSSAEKS